MKIVVLGSGSKGNSVYIETKKTKILIDAGLSYIETINRLSLVGIKLDQLTAIFITHEHIDHTSGIVRLMKATNAKLFMEENSFYGMKKAILNNINFENVYFIKEKKKYILDDLAVVPITLSHDSVNCFGYLLKSGNATYAHLTDTGIISHEYFKLLSLFDTILIESNHDVNMLQLSNRPFFLKHRILSNCGHLSNELCCSYLQKIVTDKTKRVILAHLSEECNDEKIALASVSQSFSSPLTFELFVAKQHMPLSPIIIGEEDV